jgi:NAD(P)-dependent dehydrogenase (short-subunit alcohol dehydrogenase family)
MAKNIVVVGFGPGTATAVAEKFGAQGFSVSLIGRNEDRLEAGVAALKARGIDAAAFTGDASDPSSIQAAIRNARAARGPITVLHWSAYGGLDAGDLLTADPAALRGIFDVAVLGLLAATKEALADLKSGDGALLISNGSFGEVTPQMDAYSVNLNVMGLALACAAKDKLVGLLAQRLQGEGVYVAEVMVYGTIKGTPSSGENAIEPSAIAEKFWELYTTRSETRAAVKSS